MDTIAIIEYSDKHKYCFWKRNYEWIKKFFVVEPSDEYVPTNFVESITDKGGFVPFAKCNDEIDRILALIKVADHTCEIAKRIPS